MSTDSLHVFRGRKADEYLIQRFANSYAAGTFTRVSAAEMSERGVDIILKYIKEEPETRKGDKPELTTMSKEERAAFYRNHLGISIHLVANTKIMIGPLRRRGSGFVVPRDKIIELSLPCTNGTFLDALVRAYD